MRFYNGAIVLYRIIVSVSHFILKITSGEILAKEVAGESGGKAKEHHRQETIKAIRTSKTSSIASKVLFKKSAITHHSIPSINTPIKALYNPIITHPKERIWAGRTPRVPDAPKIKHDKMKQFYMIDMGRKMW